MSNLLFQSSRVQLKYIFLALLLLLPTIVLGDCTCESENEDRNKKLALTDKLIAIASILACSAIGVYLPVVGKVYPAFSPESNLFFVVKAFAAGVILSTGFIHVLPDAFENLTSPCISASPWGDFPFAGFIAMLSAIVILMIDTYATSYYNRRTKAKVPTDDGKEAGGIVPLHTHATHGHAHGPMSLESGSGETELGRHRVTAWVLEVGIIVHSVIIGIALGASQSPKTIRPLIAALSFHQMFEGIGLGGCLTQAKFEWRAIAKMGIFFTLTVPVSAGVGIWISKIYSETSPNALIVEGVFNSASAGILIYMALVDLLAADFMSPKMQANGKLQLWANAALLFGAGCMSLLAKWA